jgi:hypothetical protein
MWTDAGVPSHLLLAIEALPIPASESGSFILHAQMAYGNATIHKKKPKTYIVTNTLV